MKLILLTHEREFDRVTNTGMLVQRRFPEVCRRVLWRRKHADPELLALIESGKAGLLYPSEEAISLDASLVMELSAAAYQRETETSSIDSAACLPQNQGRSSNQSLSGAESLKTALPEVIILLDATWQEAAKMYRQSAYLQTIPGYMLENTLSSEYARRRNQKAGGLCTLECAAILLSLAGTGSAVELLLKDLQAHNHKAFDCHQAQQ